jgi:YD repeat-containing protein
VQHVGQPRAAPRVARRVRERGAERAFRRLKIAGSQQMKARDLGADTASLPAQRSASAARRRCQPRSDSLTMKDVSGQITGAVTSFGYDALGRLTSVRQDVPGASPIVTTYGYDDRGNRTSVTDANDHLTTFEYDRANRLTKETTPITTVTQFTYYADGSRETKTDGKGQITTYSYNGNRQLTHVDYDGQTSADFDYTVTEFTCHADGSREAKTDGKGQITT